MKPARTPPARVAMPGIAGQFTFPRGRWLRVCPRHAGALLPRNQWTVLSAAIATARSRA